MIDLRHIEALIDAHVATWLALNEACETTDNASGADAIAVAEAAQEKASDATHDAIYAIIEHPYSSIEELRRGIAYLVAHHGSTGDGNLGEWLADMGCNLVGVSKEEAA